jgi:hypothetical protein
MRFSSESSKIGLEKLLCFQVSSNSGARPIQAPHISFLCLIGRFLKTSVHNHFQGKELTSYVILRVVSFDKRLALLDWTKGGLASEYDWLGS